MSYAYLTSCSWTQQKGDEGHDNSSRALLHMQQYYTRMSIFLWKVVRVCTNEITDGHQPRVHIVEALARVVVDKLQTADAAPSAKLGQG